MKSNELKSRLFFLFIFGGIVSILLVIFPFVEPIVLSYFKAYFGMSDAAMGNAIEIMLGNLVKFSKVILWMCLVVAIVRFFNALIFATALGKAGNLELTTLLRNVLSIVIYVGAFFTFFKSQFPNTDLTSLFAGSTIIGVVIGLAMQDTLGNLFAGLAMQADQPFQIGDVITVPNKGTGVVESISWRGMKIRTFQNKIIVISNTVLGKDSIEVAPKDNLNARLVFFNTLYSASPTKTIHLIRDVVRQVENVSNKIRPIVRIRNLGDSGLDWEIKYWLDDYSKYNDTDALVRQRVWYAFQRENIHFAFPTRTIYYENQSLEPDFVESVNEIFERLSDVEIFEPLSDEETMKLAESCEAKIFSPNEPVVRKGQEGNSMFVVHRGAVNLQVIENGFSKTVATLREGEYFGEMALLTGQPRSATVVASGETEVLEIKQDALKPLFEKNPYLIEEFTKTIDARRKLLAIEKPEMPQFDEPNEGLFNSIRKFFGMR
jgi:small-conductance mechanosensitive channel/CRP-like cAMP-binding protein